MIIGGGQNKSYSIQMMKTENNSLDGFQKRIEQIDEQIAKVKENENINGAEKIKKIKALEEQKEELMVQLQKEKAEKTKENRDKIHKEISKQAPQPIEESDQLMSAGVSTAIIESSTLLNSIKEQTTIASGLRREAKILQKEVETDMGRGQKIDSKDYRMEKIKKDKKSANKIDENISDDIKELYEKKDVEKKESKNNEPLEDTKNEKEKILKEGNYSAGQHVDVTF